MGLFDKVFEEGAKLADKGAKLAGNAINTVADKGGDAIEKGKKKVELMGLENDKEKALKALGAYVYNAKKTGEENATVFEQYLEAVAEIEKKIEAVNANEPEEIAVGDVEKKEEDDGPADEIIAAVEGFAKKTGDFIGKGIAEIKENLKEADKDVKETEETIAEVEKTVEETIEIVENAVEEKKD